MASAADEIYVLSLQALDMKNELLNEWKGYFDWLDDVREFINDYCKSNPSFPKTPKTKAKKRKRIFSEDHNDVSTTSIQETPAGRPKRAAAMASTFKTKENLSMHLNAKIRRPSNDEQPQSQVKLIVPKDEKEESFSNLPYCKLLLKDAEGASASAVVKQEVPDECKMPPPVIKLPDIQKKNARKKLALNQSNSSFLNSTIIEGGCDLRTIISGGPETGAISKTSTRSTQGRAATQSILSDSEDVEVLPKETRSRRKRKNKTSSDFEDEGIFSLSTNQRCSEESVNQLKKSRNTSELKNKKSKLSHAIKIENDFIPECEEEGTSSVLSNEVNVAMETESENNIVINEAIAESAEADTNLCKSNICSDENNSKDIEVQFNRAENLPYDKNDINEIPKGATSILDNKNNNKTSKLKASKKVKGHVEKSEISSDMNNLIPEIKISENDISEEVSVSSQSTQMFNCLPVDLENNSKVTRTKTLKKDNNYVASADIQNILPMETENDTALENVNNTKKPRKTKNKNTSLMPMGQNVSSCESFHGFQVELQEIENASEAKATGKEYFVESLPEIPEQIETRQTRTKTIKKNKKQEKENKKLKDFCTFPQNIEIETDCIPSTSKENKQTAHSNHIEIDPIPCTSREKEQEITNVLKTACSSEAAVISDDEIRSTRTYTVENGKKERKKMQETQKANLCTENKVTEFLTNREENDEQTDDFERKNKKLKKMNKEELNLIDAVIEAENNEVRTKRTRGRPKKINQVEVVPNNDLDLASLEEASNFDHNTRSTRTKTLTKNADILYEEAAKMSTKQSVDDLLDDILSDLPCRVTRSKMRKVDKVCDQKKKQMKNNVAIQSLTVTKAISGSSPSSASPRYMNKTQSVLNKKKNAIPSADKRIFTAPKAKAGRYVSPLTTNKKLTPIPGKGPSNILSGGTFIPAPPTGPSPGEVEKRRLDELKRKREKEEEISLKREEMMKLKKEEQKKKNEAKMLRALKTREEKERKLAESREVMEQERRVKEQRIKECAEAKKIEVHKAQIIKKQLEQEKREEQRLKEESKMKEERLKIEEQLKEEQRMKEHKKKEELQMKEKQKLREERRLEEQKLREAKRKKAEIKRKEEQKRLRAKREFEKKKEAEYAKSREEKARQMAIQKAAEEIKENTAKHANKAQIDNANSTYTVEDAKATPPNSEMNSTYTKTADTGSKTASKTHQKTKELSKKELKYKLKSKDDYGIDYFSSGDETDDENRPKKPIPTWAHDMYVKSSILKQGSTKPRNVFPKKKLFRFPQVRDLFNGYRFKTHVRRSTANWATPPSKIFANVK